MSKKFFDNETVVSAIKEVAAVIAKNGGADIRAVVQELNNGKVGVQILIGPYQFKAEREAAEE